LRKSSTETGYATIANTLVPFRGKWFLYCGAADRVISSATYAEKPRG